MTDKPNRQTRRAGIASSAPAIVIEGTGKVPLDFVDLDEIVPVQCNQVMVQHVGDQFVLAFNLVLFPMTRSPQRIKSVKCRTMAKVTMAPETMEAFLGAANKNHETWRAAKTKKTSVTDVNEDLEQAGE